MVETGFFLNGFVEFQTRRLVEGREGGGLVFELQLRDTQHISPKLPHGVFGGGHAFELIHRTLVIGRSKQRMAVAKLHGRGHFFGFKLVELRVIFSSSCKIAFAVQHFGGVERHVVELHSPTLFAAQQRLGVAQQLIVTPCAIQRSHNPVGHLGFVLRRVFDGLETLVGCVIFTVAVVNHARVVARGRKIIGAGVALQFVEQFEGRSKFLGTVIGQRQFILGFGL